ncbi:MAG: PqqD family protein [Bacteroidaceae bacterium]|nr:PqqD family protein [Bacteroidaceae bacterium]
MRIKEGFNLRNVCGENIVVAEGEANIDFTSVISVNETAACIWKAVSGKDFDVNDMVEALMAEYEVDRETAERDCQQLAIDWKKADVLQ